LTDQAKTHSFSHQKYFQTTCIGMLEIEKGRDILHTEIPGMHQSIFEGEY